MAFWSYGGKTLRVGGGIPPSGPDMVKGGVDILATPVSLIVHYSLQLLSLPYGLIPECSIFLTYYTLSANTNIRLSALCAFKWTMSMWVSHLHRLVYSVAGIQLLHSHHQKEGIQGDKTDNLRN